MSSNASRFLLVPFSDFCLALNFFCAHLYAQSCNAKDISTSREDNRSLIV